MKLNVLVACESSGTVRDAFRALGHNAWSCDLLPCDTDPRYHMQCDAFTAIHDPQSGNYWRCAPPTPAKWDLMIAHPPCTYLCNSGVRWLFTPSGSSMVAVNHDRWDAMRTAARFFCDLWNAPIPYLAIENPIQHKYAKDWHDCGQQDQVVQPWMFGHYEKKATCLWLKNLPLLEPSVPDAALAKQFVDCLPRGQQQRMWSLPPSKNRWKLRSKTYEGIAKAMATQWSKYIINEKQNAARSV